MSAQSQIPHYSREYFNLLEPGSCRSAGKICGLLNESLPIRSVLDVGCGRGAWLAAWRGLGVVDLFGIDGEHVDAESLLIPAASFMGRDLARPFRLGRRFELVQSLEVAEHLPESSADGFVDSLVEHGDLILFSAAVPGQTGVHHVNEQPLHYWKAKFEQRGYVAIDAIRPRVAGLPDVELWYRCNILLYARAEILDRLPESLHRMTIPAGRRPVDYSPLGFKIYKWIFRVLPKQAFPALMSWLLRFRSARRTGPELTSGSDDLARHSWS